MCGALGILIKNVRYNWNQNEKMCGTAEILMKNVRYNGNSNETCAVQWESSPDHPSRPIKTYDQRLYRPARKSGKKHKKTYNSPPRRPAASRTKRTMHGAIVRPENPKKNIQSNWSCLIGRLVGCWLLWVVDNPRRGSLRGQKCAVQLKS